MMKEKKYLKNTFVKGETESIVPIKTHEGKT
jgi:hypothetical protein